MNRYIALLIFASVPCLSDGANFSPRDFVGVTCSSADGGKSCYGYAQTYADGTMDSCGRVPGGGPKFAMTFTYTITKNTKCDTVVKTTDPKVMPVGTTFCAIYLERKPDGFTYRYDDDAPAKVRRLYTSSPAAKWCQPLIDAL